MVNSSNDAFYWAVSGIAPNWCPEIVCIDWGLNYSHALVYTSLYLAIINSSIRWSNEGMGFRTATFSSSLPQHGPETIPAKRPSVIQSNPYEHVPIPSTTFPSFFRVLTPHYRTVCTHFSTHRTDGPSSWQKILPFLKINWIAEVHSCRWLVLA